MNLMAVLNLIAAIGFGVALAVTITAAESRLSAAAKLFLCLALSTCLFASVANVLQHTGVTDRLDVYEDYAEILFVPFSLCFIYALWTKQELTRRRGVEEALAHERHLLHAIMDNAPDRIYFKDARSRFTRISKAQAARFGLASPADALDKADFDFFTDEHARQAFQDEQEIMRTGQPLVGKEERETWPDGSETWASTTKLPLRDADGRIIGTFGISRDITQRKHAEEQLRKAEQDKEVVLATVPDLVIYLDTDMRVVRANRAAGVSVETTPERLVGRRCHQIWHGRAEPCESCPVIRALAANQAREGEMSTPDGRTWLIRGFPARDDDGRIIGAVEIASEITERRQIEEQLRQAQKMEAVGRLAGGIAHDFNNQLTVVKGYCDLLLASPRMDGALAGAIQEIQNAAARAAALTSHLLAFGRKQLLHPEVVDLNEVISGMAEPLRRMIGEDIRLSIVAADDLDSVRADPMLFEQAVMNLVVNARDAMPDGGTLTMTTANVNLDDGFAAAHPGATRGPHVLLTIRDTGTGMDEETRERIFEPFFSTKPVGQGTGLGLPMVYGFVRQSGGQIYVTSRPGQGTTFEVYLPQVEPADALHAPQGPAETARRGSETILVAEDDAGVRQFVVRVLRSSGYTVLEAASAKEAIRLAGRHDSRAKLLVTDVVMPGTSGPELARRLRAVRPTMPVLYVSGHTEETLRRQVAEDRLASFLRKPFSPDVLAGTVRRILDRATAHASQRA